MKVLFTVESDNLKEGAKHLADGELWVRQLEIKGKPHAYIYGLDKVILSEFADLFGLTKFERGVELYMFGYHLTTFRISVWGKKLEHVLGWKKGKIQQDDSERTN